MSIIECNNKLHQQIINKINSWPPESVNYNLISNISNNISYISNNFTYNLSNISYPYKSNASNDQTKTLNQNGKFSTNTNKLSSNASSTSSSSATLNGKLINGDSNILKQTNNNQETNGILNSNNNKSPKSTTPITSPTHSRNLSNSSIIPVINTKLDEDLIDLVFKLNQKCEFLNKYGQRHDYTGKQVNGYFSMLRIIHSFFEYILNSMEKKKRKAFADLIEVANLLLVILETMEQYAKKYAELRLRYDNEDYNLDLLTDNEDEEESIKKKVIKEDGDQNNSDTSNSEDELDEINNFDNISSNLVKMSSNLANSIESMKSLCENAFDDLANNNESYDSIIIDDEEVGELAKEKIEDYYRENELKDIEDDKEYGKEIKKEEYESTLQKYYKRFNFNFKISKSNSCTSPVNEDASTNLSPKKMANSSLIASNNQRPDSPKKMSSSSSNSAGKIEKKYYKYFSSLKNNFEENFNRLTNTSYMNNSETSSLKTAISDDTASITIASTTTTTISSPKNGKLVNSSSSNALKRSDQIIPTDGIFLEDSLDQEELNQETEEEKQLRQAKLDEYILSKFSITNDDLHLVTPPMLGFYEGFTLTLNREKELALIYGRVGAFWYCKSAANIVSLVRNLAVILTSPPSKSIASLCNTDYCARVFAHRQVNATLDSLLQVLGTLEVKAYNRRYFKYLYREHVIYGKTIKLPVFSEFEIPSEGNELIHHKPNDKSTKSNEHLDGFNSGSSKEKNQTFSSNESQNEVGSNDLNGSTINDENENDKISLDDIGFNSRMVRCRLINYVRNQNETEICENSHKCLLFHVHGGGFILGSPDSHELYLRDWAVKLKGISILSIDYQLRSAFPKAIQDVLDVYLFLVNPNNKQSVSEMIGFIPENIILAGDSAGANLALSLICCLNEIRRNNSEYANIRMPNSIISVYGAFDIRAVMSPSKFISSIDPILHHGNIMAMIGTYAGIAQKIRKTIWSRIKYRRSLAWYRVSERELKARFKTLSKSMESFFASPLTYPHLNDLKDISLHLISTHFCPLLDDSVVLYKAWRGISTFDIYDGLPHAFLNFCDRSEEAKIATDKCAERIIQAFVRKSQNDQKNKN